MYKKYIITILILSINLFQAQIVIEDLQNNVFINDGEVLSFNSGAYPEGAFNFLIHNQTTEELKIQMEIVELNNTDGSRLNVEFGLSILGVYEGLRIPSIGIQYIAIPAGGTQLSNYDMVWNWDNIGIDPNLPMSYVIRFLSVDENGNEIDDLFSFTYHMPAALGVNANANQIPLEIYPTTIRDSFTVKCQEQVTLDIYDLLGRHVKGLDINTDIQQVDISNLSAQTYVLRFKNKDGKQTVEKVLKL